MRHSGDAPLESELFGHEKGAFTGAQHLKQRASLEIAKEGTVFLDEVGSSHRAPGQAAARAAGAHFERVGGTHTPVNLRLIAATNRNLLDAVKDGSFRNDLYYRLNVVSLTMPALRERRGWDIPMLAEYFVAKQAARFHLRHKTIAPEAMARLMTYEWPGNVRELENAIERALVLGISDVIGADDVPGGGAPWAGSLSRTGAEIPRRDQGS